MNEERPTDFPSIKVPAPPDDNAPARSINDVRFHATALRESRSCERF